ncbi:MAG: serine hydrolase domain-containing protein [Pseudomonadales bacterium]
MSKRILLAALLTAGTLTSAADTPDPMSNAEFRGALALLDRWTDAYQVYGRVPGLSVGVVMDQDLVWSKGYGYANVRRKVPADTDTLYSICSISKLFTSIALMQQRDAGKLQLDDPVARHLEWFDIQQTYPDSGPITVRSLLTHSSGLPRESVHYYWNPDYPFPTRDELIAGLAGQETLYPEGKYFQYSNLALTLAGEIAASAAGKPYEDLVQDAILTPLGLADTRPYLPRELHGSRMAIGYGPIDREGKRTTEPPFDAAGIRPAAGFTSSVRDLARFASWQFRLLENGGEEVLKASTLREMQRVQWVDPDWKTTWGLGFIVEHVGDKTVVGHDGGCPGYITQFSMMPKHKLAVVVLTNAGDGDPFRVTQAAYKLLGAAHTAMQKAPTEPLPDLSAYEGLYHIHPWASEVAVVQMGPRLAVATLPSLDPTEGLVKLEQIDDDLFRRVRESDDDLGESWTFERNAAGAVTGLHYHGVRMTRAD